jgi:hypothetical protein
MPGTPAFTATLDPYDQILAKIGLAGLTKLAWASVPE